MKRIIALLLMFTLVLTVFTSCGSDKAATNDSSVPADDTVYTLKLGSNTAASNPENIYAYKLSELVNEATDGHVVIQVYDSAQLGDHLERLEGLRMGTVDMTLTSIGYLGGYDPVFNIFEMPYLFVSDEHQHAVYNSEVRDMLAADAKEYGFILVDCLEQGARHITNSVRPIYTPDDLAGLKLRVPDTTSSIDALSAMGATPTPLAFSELYLALQQQTVDGQENPLATAFSSKFQEVQKYLSLTGHQRIEQILVCSQSAWDKLPEEYRAVIDACKEEANAYMREVIKAEESNIIQGFKDAGVEVNEVDVNLFVTKVNESGLREKYVQQYGEKAQAYFEAIDALK
ncbi:MAG: TRAP transporter substrate-binding protein [Roseburia sp.]|nr:TRAP transporter substrate-binding protein [Roseburia sp.]